jgi:D-alanine-D-alanine ligase
MKGLNNMSKIKLGVIFGGMSTEHEVSITSGTSVIKNLDKEKYEIYPIYIDKDGNWFEYTKKIQDIDIIEVGEEIKEKTKIINPIEYIQECDVIFPVLHGLYGEDGTIQGMLELLNKPYVGCKVLSSSISMDKVYAKFIFENSNIDQAKYVYIRSYNDKYIYIDKEFNETIVNLDDIAKIVENKLGYPVFVKPSNSGSSIGINKAKNKLELEKYIEEAAKYDRKILIEEEIKGREVECAILGNEDVMASGVGEILSAEEFYTFDAKYKNNASRTVIPADIDEKIVKKIRETAIKAFKAVDGKGFARVDFFVENKTNDIKIIEINTIPGFTQISMYPKLWEQEGVAYGELLDKLIDLALEENK